MPNTNRQSLWSRIADAVAALSQGEGLAAVFDRLRGVPERSPERTVAFTIAVIALGAKMAKADGEVTRDEVAAFRRLFTIPPGEEANAARVFNLARQDVAGFDAYARKIRAMFADTPDGTAPQVLTDLLESLFRIAVSDAALHDAEEAFLHTVADIFGVGEKCFSTLLTRYTGACQCDPYDVLGIPCDAPLDQARAAWRQAVMDSHPDAMQARGVPPEAIRLAEERLIAVNRAWEEISSRQAA
ncbi:MAG: molecular chaperone DjiA [Paracoccaceae bacterium]